MPKGFWNIVGTDVESAVWDGDSYCGGYFENVGLETTQLWLNACSDGFLDCSSQSAAGRVWFQDKARMAGAEPLSRARGNSADGAAWVINVLPDETPSPREHPGEGHDTLPVRVARGNGDGPAGLASRCDHS